MTLPTAAERLDRWHTRVEKWLLYAPYLTMSGSLALVLVAAFYDAVPHHSIAGILALSAVTLCWVYWWVTRHPHWSARRPHMTVYFLGLLVLIGGLIWLDPLFGFFAWTGYLYTYALPGWWCLAGAAGVAGMTATSQMGGFGIFADSAGWPTFGVVLLINTVIAMTMTFVSRMGQDQSQRRAQMLDELAATNAKLAEALTENAGLHAQLLAQAREAGVLDERQRMAGEIHDVLAQGLTGIVTQLEAAEQTSGTAEWRRHLSTARALARESLTEARRSVQALRPQPLDRAALPEAIGELAASWSARHGVSAELVTTGTPRPLLPEIEATLLRTAQESLANVARHAKANRVGLTLSYMEDVVTLDVRDDGRGFDPELPRDPAYQGGYGLSAMRERVARIAGTLAVESEPGNGTAISACVPAITMGAAA